MINTVIWRSCRSQHGLERSLWLQSIEAARMKDQAFMCDLQRPEAVETEYALVPDIIKTEKRLLRGLAKQTVKRLCLHRLFLLLSQN